MKKNKITNRIPAPKTPRGETAGTVFKTLFLCLILGVAGLGVWIGMWVTEVLAETPEFNPENIIVSRPALIFDSEGDLIQEWGERMSEWVPLNEISPVMIDALLAIEDARFYGHAGVDWTGTLRAVIYTIEGMITGRDSMQGGSTLTQQLVNQTHLLLDDGERDVSFERKLQEVLLASQVEQVFSKEQIIEAYLNIAPFGGIIIGIQAAAQFYFGVDASQLTLSQAATLAGIVQLPNVFRPDWHAQNTLVRRNEVLDLMVHHDFITQEIADLAAAEPFTDLLVYHVPGIDDRERYQPFIDRVFEEANNRFGISNIAGYEIHTTLDRPAQAFVYNMLMTNDYIAWPNDDFQTAVAMISNDGAIRALAGRDLGNTTTAPLGWNFAAHETRQPGSASKPIWAYMLAFEYLNWGTGSMIVDDVMGLDGWAAPGAPIVTNHDNLFRGRHSVRDSMNMSWNVPAVVAMREVLDSIGQDRFTEIMNTIGFATPTDGFVPRYAIGGHADGVTALDMAGAFAIFPSGGVFNEPYTITRIIAPDGTVIFGEDYHTSERIISEASAFMMNSILHSSVWGSPGSWATGGAAQVPGQWVAGKTGTTNFDETHLASIRARGYSVNSNATKDAWFVGYSLDYTVAVWSGYDLAGSRFMNQQNAANGVRYANFPQLVFRNIMQELNTAGNQSPTQPPGISFATVELRSGERNGQACWPSNNTPPSAQRTEIFHSHAMPNCNSDRFEAPETPENFRVTSAGGLRLNFRWDHLDDEPMTLQEAINRREAARWMHGPIQAGWLTSPTPGEAYMQAEKITLLGETEYVVKAILANGNTIELDSTTEDNITITLTMNEAQNIQSFHVITRFANANRESQPSNSVPNRDLIDPSDIIIDVPNMQNWTLQRLENWADDYGINFTTITAYHATIENNHVISTNPSTTIRLNQVLQVTLSRGAEPVAPDIPGSPTNPDDNDDTEVYNPQELD